MEEEEEEEEESMMLTDRLHLSLYVRSKNFSSNL